jgi:hypothetical protein
MRRLAYYGAPDGVLDGGYAGGLIVEPGHEGLLDMR